MIVITRSKGVTGEREERIQVPDMWHLYEQLKEAAEAAGAIFDFEKSLGIKWSDEARPDQTIKVEITLAGLAKAAADVYDCWQLCHDLFNHIESTGTDNRVNPTESGMIRKDLDIPCDYDGCTRQAKYFGKKSGVKKSLCVPHYSLVYNDRV